MAQALYLLRFGLKLHKGKTLRQVRIGLKWMVAYAQAAQRVDHERHYGITRFPYEPGTAIMAFAGGFFDHPEWPLWRALEKQGSMRAVADHEFKYVNATGYWLTFQNAAVVLQSEHLDSDPALAHRLDVWG